MVRLKHSKSSPGALMNHVVTSCFINDPFTNCSVHVDNGEEIKKFKAHKTSPLNTLYYD